jgi:hypothetical protein
VLRNAGPSFVLASSPLKPFVRRRFYATEDGAKAGGGAPTTAAQPAPTSSPIISIQTTEEYQKLVLDASKTKPIIVDCYAEYDTQSII